MKILEESFLKWWIEDGNHAGYKGLLFDIDGTLISGKRMLPGSYQLMEWIEEKKFPFFLLTNDGNHSPEEKSAHMTRTGLKVHPDEIISCSMALYDFVKDKSLQGKRFFVMGDLGEPCYAERAGLVVERDTSKTAGCAGVIVGEGYYDWHSNMSAVMNFFISNPKAYFIVPNPDSYWPNGPNGEIGIGAGGKARFLCSILQEYGLFVKPIYLGKPYKGIFRYAYEELRHKYKLSARIPKRKFLMLGDSLRSDIAGARNFGFSAALLLTGITNFEHVRKVKVALRPDFVFKTIGG